jgi:hypothetical protein
VELLLWALDSDCESDSWDGQHWRFCRWHGCEPGEETVSEPNADEAVVFEEFFSSCFRMPPHHVLSAILLKYQIQIHQLTPNAIVQLSKYIWTVTSFGGAPSIEGFAKRFELHYQLRNIVVNGIEVQGQYGHINFQVNHGGHLAKLTVALKNKWSEAWMKA